jgi:hypothetical protein
MNAVQTLHLFYLRREVKLIRLINDVANSTQNEKSLWKLNTVKYNLNKILFEILQLDLNSIKWLNALACIQLGDHRSFMFIGRKLKIPKIKINMYRAL